MNMRKFSHFRIIGYCLGLCFVLNAVKIAFEAFKTSSEFYNRASRRSCFDDHPDFGITSRLVNIEKLGYYDGEEITNTPSIVPEPNFDQDFWGTVTLPPGKAFQINTHDPSGQDVWISWSVHKRKIWDESVWIAIKTIILASKAKQVVFVDVGANIGYFTLAAAALGAKVFAFEPMNRNILKLVSSIQRNGFTSQIMLFHNAVTDISGDVVSFRQTAPTNAGNGQLLPSSSRGFRTFRRRYGIDMVSTVRLDAVLDTDIELIKIDVEGYEGHVLAGARRLLCCRTVRYVLIEFLPAARTSATAQTCPPPQVFAWMSALGYRISDISPPPPGARSLSPTLDLARFPQNLLFSLDDSDSSYAGPPALRRDPSRRPNATVCPPCV